MKCVPGVAGNDGVMPPAVTLCLLIGNYTLYRSSVYAVSTYEGRSFGYRGALRA